MKNITGGAFGRMAKIDPVFRAFQELELVLLIEQGYIDASGVGGIGGDVLVSLGAQRRFACEVVNHAVVFDFVKSHERRRVHFADGGNDTGNVSELVPILALSLIHGVLGEKLVVVFLRVVFRVEKIFHVVKHYPKIVLRRHFRKRGKRKTEYRYRHFHGVISLFI